MTLSVANRVKETSTTTGTGDLTLGGAVSQFQSCDTAFGLSVYFQYAIVGQGSTEWETGLGYLSGSTTLVRERVYSSSNSNALVNFSSGTKDVFCTLLAEEIVTRGQALATSRSSAWV
ncbi:MAG: hypothetical protein ABL879_15410 [Devosia sp.]